MTQPHNPGSESVESLEPTETLRADKAAATEPAATDVRTGDELKASLSKPDPLLKRIWAQSEGKVGMVLTGAVLLVTLVGYFFAEQLTGYSTTEFLGLPFVSDGVFLSLIHI